MTRVRKQENTTVLKNKNSTWSRTWDLRNMLFRPSDKKVHHLASASKFEFTPCVNGLAVFIKNNPINLSEIL